MTLKFSMVLAILVVATACEKSPTRPSSTDSGAAAQAAPVADANSGTAAVGVTLIAPVLVTPADNAQIRNASQPITLVLANGVSTGSTAPTYTFEVASDSGFATKVYTKDGVAQGANGQTSLVIDKLAPAKSYFWRARTNSASTPGPYSKARGFTVGPEVILQTPVLGDPGANATVGESPTLSVNNVQRSGPAGQIVYRFEVSAQSNFSSLVYAGTSNERSDLPFTSHSVTIKLGENTYWWRVQASDPSNAVTSPFSGGNPFRVQPFSMSQATIVSGPPDLALWPETAKITSIFFNPGNFQVDFDKRNPPNRWPDTPFGQGDLQYTLGLCLNINGHWYCSAVVQFWYGRSLGDSGPPSQIDREWFYDPARWGPMTGHQPADGEIVGVFVAAGNVRNASYNMATCPRVCERSNVQLVPWSNGGGADYNFSVGRSGLLKLR